MTFQAAFPIWDKLRPEQQDLVLGSLVFRSVEKGAVLHSGGTGCTGLILVESGQLRAYMISEDGREITLYRLFDRDLCLFSASCMMHSIQFDVTVQAERDTELWILPAEVYRSLMEASLPVSNYTNEVMASRFSDVMWLMEQVLWKSFDRRLAAFLLEEANLTGGTVLKTTHEAVGSHLGNPREVVTRMLRYFQSEGAVRLRRGVIELTDLRKLREIAGS